MKKITEKTVLVQGDKTFQPVEVDGVIYWIDFYTKKGSFWCIDTDKKIFKDEIHFPISIGQRKIIAQSEPKLEGVPVIDKDEYWKLNLCYYDSRNPNSIHLDDDEIRPKNCYCDNCNYGRTDMAKSHFSDKIAYTQKDIEKAIELARTLQEDENEFEVENILGSSDGTYGIEQKYTEDEIIEQINFISVIQVDKQFNILNYE